MLVQYSIVAVMHAHEAKGSPCGIVYLAILLSINQFSCFLHEINLFKWFFAVYMLLLQYTWITLQSKTVANTVIRLCLYSNISNANWFNPKPSVHKQTWAKFFTILRLTSIQYSIGNPRPIHPNAMYLCNTPQLLLLSTFSITLIHFLPLFPPSNQSL